MQTQRHKRWRDIWRTLLLNALFGIPLALLVHQVLVTSLTASAIAEKLQILQLADALDRMPVNIAAAVGLLYTLHPLLGSVTALAVMFPMLALYHYGLAVIYAACALIALPCLGRRGGIFLFALAALVAKYPAPALLLPFLPVLAGLLYGRWMGWYAAAALAVVVLVAGLIAGKATLGVVYIGGEAQPLMKSEMMVMIKDIFPLPLADDQVAETRDIIRDIGLGNALLISLAGGWGLLWLLGAYGVIVAELQPRFTSPLLAQVLLWAIVGSVTAWIVWALARRPSASRLLGVVTAVAVTGILVAGHIVVLSRAGAPIVARTVAIPALLTSVLAAGMITAAMIPPPS